MNSHYLNAVSTDSIVFLCAKALRFVDPRLIDHGERVAYIACEILKEMGITDIDDNILLPLCVFHDIGAYKTEEIDRMVEFENENVFEHSVYGYLFLKHFTPLKPYSEVILYHHTGYQKLKKINYKYAFIADLIHLADRLDILVSYEQDITKIESILSKKDFDPNIVDGAKRALENDNIINNMQNNDYMNIVLERVKKCNITKKDALAYLQMLVYTIDFKSRFTVVHSVSTTKICTCLADLMGLSESETARLYIAALVHDIGKIAIDASIIEKQGKLTDEEMAKMRLHVEHSREILDGILPEPIVAVAVRHHEKLNGKGYPLGLCDSDLSLSDRIIAVADIMCALTGKRSYKDVFPKEKTIAILNDMVAQGELDKTVVKAAVDNYELILDGVEKAATPIADEYEKMQIEYNQIITKK